NTGRERSLHSGGRDRKGKEEIDDWCRPAHCVRCTVLTTRRHTHRHTSTHTRRHTHTHTHTHTHIDTQTHTSRHTSYSHISHRSFLSTVLCSYEGEAQGLFLICVVTWRVVNVTHIKHQVDV